MNSHKTLLSVAFMLSWTLSVQAGTEILKNGDFSVADSNGIPVSWSCHCGTRANSGCTSKASNDGKSRVLVIAPGCASYQVVHFGNHAQGIHFGLDAIGTNIDPLSFRLTVYGLNTEAGNELVAGRVLSTTDDGWKKVQSATVSSSNPTTENAVFSANNYGISDITLANVSVIQEGSSPANKAGSLIYAAQDTRYSYRPGKGGQIWFPLPLQYASQVPLGLNFKVDPSTAAESVKYTTDEYGNAGVTVEVADSDTSGEFRVHWDAVVLTRILSGNERAEVYKATEDPAIWLKAAPLVDAAFAGIHDLGVSLNSEASDPVSAMENVIQWTSKNVKFGGANLPEVGLTATDVFLNRHTSCTGFANLAAAIGRASLIPTRTVANILVGEPQATHYINEFYLGEGLGWRRVEPQGDRPVVAEDYGVILRKNRPDQDEQVGTSGAMPGVPRLSLPEIISSGNRIARLKDSALGGGITLAEIQATLYTDPAQMKAIFQEANTRWTQIFGTPAAAAMYSRVQEIDNIEGLKSLYQINVTR